ncbi:ornithine cyclodeaminase [Bordetella pertussis]|nr:ornithine cyclodeaminase [Bordetella pertussis]
MREQGFDAQAATDLQAAVGRAAGRRDAAEITVFKAVGSALEDLTLAAQVYEARQGDVQAQ